MIVHSLFCFVLRAAIFFLPVYFLCSCKTEANLFLTASADQNLNFINPVCHGITDSGVKATAYFSMAFSQEKEKVTQTPETIKVTGQSSASSLCVFAHKLKAAIPIPVYLTVMNHRWYSQ